LHSKVKKKNIAFASKPIISKRTIIHKPYFRRRPVLEGDNWWRGHAAAFLKYANVTPEVLRKGRVNQTKREAAYFVVVLHYLSTVVIAIRGTETPEDVITDGLCKECFLNIDDLDGLINSDHLSPQVKSAVLSSPHYGHAGIVESARELYAELEGHPIHQDKSDTVKAGFLSSLLGDGCECHGYNIQIVGHSLGGSVAALLGIKVSLFIFQCTGKLSQAT